MLRFDRIHRWLRPIGQLLEIGKIPPPPERTGSLVVVPVGGMSRLTAEGISAALSTGVGFVLDRAIQQDTANVVICRLRFRPTAWSGPGAPSAASPDAAAQPQSPAQTTVADDGG